MRIKFFNSIWMKLWLHMLGIISLSLIIISFGVLLAARQILEGELKNSVSANTQNLAIALSREFSDREDLENFKIDPRQFKKISRVSIYVLDPRGRVISGPTDEKRSPVDLTETEIKKITSGEKLTKVKHSPDPNNRLLYSVAPVMKNGKVKAAVMTVIPLSQPLNV